MAAPERIGEVLTAKGVGGAAPLAPIAPDVELLISALAQQIARGEIESPERRSAA